MKALWSLGGASPVIHPSICEHFTDMNVYVIPMLTHPDIYASANNMCSGRPSVRPLSCRLHSVSRAAISLYLVDGFHSTKLATNIHHVSGNC